MHYGTGSKRTFDLHQFAVAPQAHAARRQTTKKSTETANGRSANHG
jgi:hypothetical protein